MIDDNTIKTYKQIRKDVDVAAIQFGISGNKECENTMVVLSNNICTDLNFVGPCDEIRFTADVRFTLDCCKVTPETQPFIDRIVAMLAAMK